MGPFARYGYSVGAAPAADGRLRDAGILSVHTLLARQVERHFGGAQSVPPELAALLATIDESYRRADEERAMLEASLDPSSSELIERHRRTEARNMALLGAHPDLVLYLGADDAVLDCRSPWPAALQRTPDACVGRPITEVLAPGGELSARLVQALDGVRRSGGVASAEFRDQWGDAPPLDLELRVIPLVRGEALAIVRDMSDIRAKEQELERARDEAEEASRAKNEFLANMSHEIRTPMNAVLGLTQLLLEGELRPRERDYANSVLEAGRSLLALINDLLDIARIEARELVLAPIDFSLASTVQETFRLFEPKARAKGLAMSIVVDPSIPQRVVGDPGRLRQILMSLLGNAVKFTPQGGISLAVTAADGDEVSFTVTDTGIGIPDDRLADILEMFTQLDAASTRRHGGTGLGLAISRHLARLMGGDIQASSELGKGSRFTLRVPLPAAAMPAEALDTTTSPMAGLRALVVNDDPDSQSRLCGDIESLGVEVEGAHTPAMALTALRGAARAGRPFDICVVNDRSSDLQSDAMARVIKRDPVLRDTVMVIIVTMGMPGDARRLFDGGYTAYLAPPLHADDIREAVAMAWQVERVQQARMLVTRHSLAERRMREAGVTNAPPPAAELARRLATPSGAHAIPPDAATAPRCLVVDDNDVNRHVAHQMLRRIGCRVVLASGGAEAVQLASSESFDLILMDVQMPDVDGFEATARIRQLQGDGRPRVPIVAVTANATRGDRQRCLDAGMDDYLAKPITRAGLYEIVQHWTRRSALVPGTPPSSAVVDDPEILDLAQLRSIVGSDKGRIQEFVAMFMTLTTPLVAEFVEGVRAADEERVRKAAHKLKGSCGSAGARQLAAIAQRAEAAAHGGASATLPALAVELEQAFARVGTLAGALTAPSPSAA